MNSYPIITSVLVISTSLAACRGNDFKRADQTRGSKNGNQVAMESPRSAPSTAETKPQLPVPFPLPVSENVDPPSNVSGALLTCSYEITPKEGFSESLMGCRLADSSGKRIVPNRRVFYSYQAVQGTDVIMRRVTNDNRYDALVLIRGIKELAQNATMKIGVSFEDQTPAIEKAVSDLLKPANQIAEARINDYAKAHDQMILDGNSENPLLVEALPTSEAELGRQLYITHCQSCHGLAGQDATKNIQRTNRDSLVGSLSTVPQMKPLDNVLSLEELAAISTFLETP